MSDDTLPGSEDPDVQQWARTAWIVREALSLMRANDVPDTLAHDLVRDWHSSTLEDDTVFVYPEGEGDDDA